MLRYVRIAVTALSLTACVLLIALWVRSYWWEDGLSGPLPNKQAFHIKSSYGLMMIAIVSATNRTWQFETIESALPDSNLLHLSSDSGFGFIDATPDYVVTFPQWLTVAMLGVIGAIPWLQKSFSLRTLLIATTMVAVGLGIVVAFS
jgi:hypothetical protein